MTQFYAALLEWSDDHLSYVRVFWAWATHMGEALDKMIACALRQQIPSPIPCQLDPYDFETLPEDVTTDDDGETYIADAVFSFPPEPSYMLPYGVIASGVEGEHDIDEIRIGYLVKSNPQGLAKLTAIVHAEDLVPFYIQMLSLLPGIRVFWVQIQADWEQTNHAEFYVHEGLATVQAIQGWLEQHYTDMVLNGHLILTTYTEQGETNVSLTDHKLLQVVGYDSELIHRLSTFLSQEQIPAIEELVTIEYGIYHWHYRHPASKTRPELIAMLKGQGFTHWNPNEPR